MSKGKRGKEGSYSWFSHDVTAAILESQTMKRWPCMDSCHGVLIQSSWNRPYSYSQYWTGTSLQWRLMRGISFQMQILFNIFPRISLHYKLVPVQYWEYEYGLLNSAFLLCKLFLDLFNRPYERGFPPLGFSSS